MIKKILGGIKIPRVPPAAMHPVAKLESYLNRFISGKAMVPMVAPEARLVPVQAAKPVHAKFVAIANPPGSLPSHRYADTYKA
jgi:hypothetical protein